MSHSCWGFSLAIMLIISMYITNDMKCRCYMRLLTNEQIMRNSKYVWSEANKMEIFVDVTDKCMRGV